MTKDRPLRVAVSSKLTDVPRPNGHGRVWLQVLEGLADSVKLVRVEPGATPTSEPDVWLCDGHGGPLNVKQPVVAAVHEVGWTTPELRGLLNPSFAHKIASTTLAAVASAARVLVPSEWSREQVIDAYGVSPDRVHTVPYGVNSELFRPGRGVGRSPVGLAAGMDNPPYVLFIGSLTPRKNIGALRHAVARLARRGFPQLLAVVLADAPDRSDSAELRRAAEAELPGAPGRIVSIPGVDDAELAELMAGADAVCLPSYSEGFGLPVLEAMACGAPVIVSDRGSLPEVVGPAGVVVPPTADAFEGALVRVLSDEGFAAKLRAAARARAQGFTWGRTVAGWLGVLERAAAEGGASAAP